MPFAGRFLSRGQTVCHRYVVLLSGLNLGSSWSDQLSVEMLTDYITGQLGGVKVSDDSFPNPSPF